MSVHALKSLIKIKRGKLSLGCSKVLRIIHFVICLVLMLIQVRDSPSHFIAETLSLCISSDLLIFSIDIHSFDILLKISQLISLIEDFVEFFDSFTDLIMLWLVKQTYD